MSKLDADSEKEALVQAYVEGTLSPGESTKLLELVREDPLLARVLMENLRMDGAIRELAGVAEKSAIVREDPPSTRSLARVRNVRTRRSRTTAASTAWIGALAAVALFTLFLLALTDFSSPELVVERRKKDAAQREALRRQSREKQLQEAQEALRQLEERLKSNDRLREDLTGSQAPRPQDPALEEKRKEDLRKLGSERELMEAELQKAVEKANQAQKEMDRPSEEPLTPVPGREPSGTVIAAKTPGVRVVPEGDVLLLAQGQRTPLRSPQELSTGQGVETSGSGRALLFFSDGTRVEIGPETRVREIKAAEAKGVDVERGVIQAHVTPQPKDRALVFLTPLGDVRVVGTTLRVAVDPAGAGSTRVDVTEGKVQLTRKSDGRSVLIPGGQYAVAAPGVELVARPAPIDEILLLPAPATLFGNEWQLVADEQSIGRVALEALPKGAARPIKSRSAYATFIFRAEANKDYALWVRGRSAGGETRTQTGGDVAVEIARGQWSARPPSDNGVLFGGLAASPSFTWSDGPAIVRFPVAGLQTLKLFTLEPVVRIDAIWLSATQRTRPVPDQYGPPVAAIAKSPMESLLDGRGSVTILFGAEGPDSRLTDPGKKLDTGKVFDPQRGYGWSRDLVGRSASDAARFDADPLHASFLWGGSKNGSETWSILLPNGRYLVQVSVGADTPMKQGPHHVRVQDQQVFDRFMTPKRTFQDSPLVPVEVRDGRLTLVIGDHRSGLKGPDDDDTVIDCIVIKRAWDAKKK